jgi:protein ImuA
MRSLPMFRSAPFRPVSTVVPARFGAGLFRQLGRLGQQGVTLGIPQVDASTDGFARAALHEIVGPSSAVSGFLAALLGRDRRQSQILWVTPGAGLHAPALAQLGLDHRRLTVVTTPRIGDRCWAAESGLDELGYGAVVAEIETPDLATTQRLQEAAEKRGAIGFLVRQDRQGSAAATRWSLQAAASDGFRPCWRLTLEQLQGIETAQSWLIEWDYAAGSFRLAA